MKTVIDAWKVSTGTWFHVFETKAEVMLFLADNSMLDKLPEGTIFTVQHVYVVADSRTPTLKDLQK